MTHETRPPAEPLSPLQTLRLPLVAIVGVLCMGSGLGNPGCDFGGDASSEPPKCIDKCAVEGRYRLTFEDTSPLGPGCAEMGLALPTEPLVITRNEVELRSTLHGVELLGSYLGSVLLPQMSIQGTGTVRNAAGTSYPVEIAIHGNFTSQPDTTSEPSVITGRYLLRHNVGQDASKCDVERAVTATRER
jgi:hypothetical protein